MRFVFSPPAAEAAGLLSLPWAEPLEDWDDERMVEIRQRGIHRHVVRFVTDGATVSRAAGHVGCADALIRCAGTRQSHGERQ